MDEKVARWVHVIILLLGPLVAVMASYSKLDSRLSLVEQRLDQETKGYAVMQSELSRRIERTESKADDLNNRLYYVEAFERRRR